jgi:hypothetical protein
VKIGYVFIHPQFSSMGSTSVVQGKAAGKLFHFAMDHGSIVLLIQLHIVLQLIYLWCHGMCAKEITHELQISKMAVAKYQKRMRDVCMFDFPRTEQIGGPGRGMIVQVDECHLYTRKYNTGRLLKETCWVFGGIDEAGQIFVERVERMDASTLIEVLVRRVFTWFNHPQRLLAWIPRCFPPQHY